MQIECMASTHKSSPEGEITQIAAQGKNEANLIQDADVVAPVQQIPASQTDAAMNLSSLASALPNYGYQNSQSMYQPSVQSGATAAMMYPYHSGQYTGIQPSQMNPYAHQSTMQYQGQRAYDNFHNNTGLASTQYNNDIYMTNPPMMTALMPSQFQNYQHGPIFPQLPDSRFGRTSKYHPTHGYNAVQVNQVYPVRASTDNYSPTMPSAAGQTPNALRGPPRKPRQSGHALWVGNLPPGANIVDLKDHFARDASDDIESVFLISKSNCAFVNYKTEDSCAAAMSRFHDSRFQGVRLVCRLRRGAASAPTLAVSSDNSEPTLSPTLASPTISATPDSDATPSEIEEQGVPASMTDGIKTKERFFIIKSLTIEDLERSAQTGIWATQSHNEVALNKAYKSAENVYLIFSANKSGEYFGYARMESPIDNDSAAQIARESPKIEQTPVVEINPQTSSILPMNIPTPATATAPRGHIIDDSARGTIFWEAEQNDPTVDGTKISSTVENEEKSETEQTAQSSSSVSPNPDPAVPQAAFGKPFKISWQSTDRLPFYRTRGLRNPWNTNREVKIARDGTEIEPFVGKKLIDMFGTQPPIQPRGHPPYPGSVGLGSGFGPNPSMPGFGRGY